MRWPTEHDGITQGFGARPHFYGKFGLPGHEGLDFRAPEGSEIYAVGDGTVVEVRLDGNADPANKPYGNQLRIRHPEGFTSVYAHLSEALVIPGEEVRAGQLVGLAGSTGNSSGAHLHLTLKKEGATDAGETTYPYDIVDPTPYLEPFSGEGRVEPDVPPEPTLEVQVESPEVGHLNVRAAPYVGAQLVGQVEHGATLGSLEAEAVTRQKVGQVGQWLHVRLPNGENGYVAAWYLTLPTVEPEPERPEAGALVVVDSPEVPLKLRSGPGTEHEILARLPDGTVLVALEPVEEVRRKVGSHGEWLRVQSPEGEVGHAAAWYLDYQPIPLEPEEEIYRYVRVESPGFGLRVRSGPGTNHEQVWWVPHATVLETLDDPFVVQRKIGTHGDWLHVRTPARKEGYVAAWYVSAMEKKDLRQPVRPARVPRAVAPYIFGMHAAELRDDPATGDELRALFNAAGKKGWVLFTQAIGHRPSGVGLDARLRRRLWKWVDEGFGVIVRLNNAYHPSGTLPESEHYDAFAATCARWAEIYLKNDALDPRDYTWTLQIGNEQNNPSEHPGGLHAPREHITPELYAAAFNKTYTALKAVLPGAVVCPGAVDPYNSSPMPLLGNARWRPLTYFEEMLEGIGALDGLVLHAYTHGPSLEAITHLATFGDPFLGDHYFDFQTYRLFMERIPLKWQEVPVHITETNHVCRPPNAPACDNPDHQGWIDANIGWVRKVYEEIDSWNDRPYAQQIRSVLLYRWTGDQWALRDKGGVLEDFRQAMRNDYRWRAPQPRVVVALAAAAATEETLPPVDERALLAADDFKILWGIGPKTEALLNAAGIVTFEQLAALSPQELRRILIETGARVRYLSSWPEQAALAAERRWADLFRYQTRMGRITPL
jgi:predicted flap endonuclease-1-like 5' DNA nuclease